jgi:hypothetical protein
VRGRKVEAEAARLLGARKKKWKWSELGASWKIDGEDLHSRTFENVRERSGTFGNIRDEDPLKSEYDGRATIGSVFGISESSWTIVGDGLQ